MDPETDAQWHQRLRSYRRYLTAEQLRPALALLRLDLAAATDERLHFAGSWGTPLEYDPAFQEVNDRERTLFLACVTLDQALEAVQEGGQS